MCGIAYAINFNGSPVNKTILARYRNQRMRGIEGFGVYDRSENNLIKTPEEGKILSWLKKYESSDLLFHHRTPTSTPNVKNACHPFSTSNFFETNYIMVHNGWVTNDDFLATKHVDDFDIKYTSIQPDLTHFNDSESLLWEFALWNEGHIPDMRASGAIAFICIARHKDGDKLYFYRNSSNPLKVVINDDGIILSSEGKGETAPADYLFCYDYNTKSLTFKELELNRYNYSGTPYTSPSYRNNWERDLEFEEKEVTGERQIRLLDDGVGQDEIDKYSYPLTTSVIKELAPEGVDLKHAKSVARYLNNKLLNREGIYEDVYEAVERDIVTWTNALKYVKRPKSQLKYKSKIQIANIAVELMFNLPFWQAENKSTDPYFLKQTSLQEAA